MNISIVNDANVKPDKTGVIFQVDEVLQLMDTSYFIEAATMFHITPSVFHLTKKTNKWGYTNKAMWRNSGNFKQCELLSFDFDDGSMSSETVSNQLSKDKINHVILGSKNHIKDKGDGRGPIERFHLFILLDEPITDAITLKDCNSWFAKERNWPVDKQVKDPARYFYCHKSCLYWWEHGINYDINPLNDRIHKQKIEKKKMDTLKEYVFRSKMKDNVDAVTKFKRSKYYRMMTDGVLRDDGNRYGQSGRIIGGMILCGLNVYEALSLFDEFSSYGSSFTRESIMRRWNNWS